MNACHCAIVLSTLAISGAPMPALAEDAPEPAASPVYVRVTGEPRRLTSMDGHEYHAHWSPDGKTIAFAQRPEGTSECTLWTVDVATGDLQQHDLHHVGDMHFDWANGGRDIIFDARVDGGPPYICRHSFETKRTQRITPRNVVAVVHRTVATPRTSPSGDMGRRSGSTMSSRTSRGR